MNEFMVEIKLPNDMNQEFLSLIPAQRVAVDRFMQMGKILGFSFSLESRKLWIISSVETENEVRSMISQFPIFGYITYEINKLTFHVTSALTFPQISLN